METPWATGLELLGEIDNSQGQTAAAPAASCPQVPGCAAGSRRATTFEVLRFRAGLQGGTAQPVAGRSPRAAIRAAGPRLRAWPCGAVVPRAATNVSRCSLPDPLTVTRRRRRPAPLRPATLPPGRSRALAGGRVTWTLFAGGRAARRAECTSLAIAQAAHENRGSVGCAPGWCVAPPWCPWSQVAPCGASQVAPCATHRPYACLPSPVAFVPLAEHTHAPSAGSWGAPLA